MREELLIIFDVPPLLTAASTTKAWPSSTFALPALHYVLSACIPLPHHASHSLAHGKHCRLCRTVIEDLLYA